LTWSFNHALLTFLLLVLTFMSPAIDNTAMPAIQLSIAERKAHRAEAHHLDPVVMIGNDGLTPAVVKETDAALNAHGLIKVRVLGDDREAREAMYQQLADQLGAAPIQHIGKLLVLWRPKPGQGKGRRRGPQGPARANSRSQVQQARRPAPRSQALRVLGNQRLTPGGQVKRAKSGRPAPAWAAWRTAAARP
jgi:RNA-binding protein